MMCLLAGFLCMAVSCSDDDEIPATGPNGGGEDNGEDPVPALQITFSEITSTSFTASWNAFEGADTYRYEVTCKRDGHVSAVTAANIEELQFTLNGLTPSTEYTVKLVAKANGKICSDWVKQTVTTAGEDKVTFAITPYERYYEGAFIYPYAQIKVSNPDVFYWVSAIPDDAQLNPVEWIKEDIAYYRELGMKWEDLIEEHLILKGDTDSQPFLFNGYNHYFFIVAQVEKNMSDISVSNEISRSYRFWYEAQDTQIEHESTYDEFVGEWLLQTTGTVRDGGNGQINIDEVKEEFLVSIVPSNDKKALYLKGFGGERNLFGDTGIKMDFEAADDNYNKIAISFPQEIQTDGNTAWKYVSWYNFIGTVNGQEIHAYLPYDDKMFESMPSWSKGFSGFVANLNRTVIKIFPENYIDGAYEGAYMLSMWPYGISTTGNVEQDKFMNGRHEEPVGPYTLIRKDVAEGLILKLPDTSVDNATQAAPLKTPRKAFSVRL